MSDTLGLIRAYLWENGFDPEYCDDGAFGATYIAIKGSDAKVLIRGISGTGVKVGRVTFQRVRGAPWTLQSYQDRLYQL